MNAPRALLLGCGVLRKEVQWLIERNHWPLDTVFLDSALHIDLERLHQSLATALARHPARQRIVFYGACHPLMEPTLATARARRVPGQNCLEMLLGRTRFLDELTHGAFFLVEDWARHWERVVTATCGDDPRALRALFQADRTYLLGVRTCCSGDFTAAAEAASRQVGLPLRWTDVTLDHLETVLRTALARHTQEDVCQS